MSDMTAVPISGRQPAASGTDRYRYRPMTVQDLDSVTFIESLVSFEPWSRSLFAGELELPIAANHWLVAEHAASGSVIGFAGTMVVADEAHILNIAVHPDHQRRGVGRRLLAEALMAGRERGAVATTLEVRSTNRSAIALYSSYGFRRAGRRRGYYRDGTDALIMWRRHSVGEPS